MKLTQSQLRKLIKEALNEMKADQADRLEAALETPGSAGTGRGIEVVKRHLGEIVGELVEGEFDPDLEQTLAGTGHSGVEVNIDKLALQVHRMIIQHLGGR